MVTTRMKGDIVFDNRFQDVEIPGVQLSKLGGPGATDVIVGTNLTPAVLMNAPGQILSARAFGPVIGDWETTRDVTVNIILALDALQINLDTLDIDFRYQFVRSGLAALADLNKAATALNPQLTVTTVEGLIDETAYSLSFTLDRSDATNPYIGELDGGFGFDFNIDAGSTISAINVIGVIFQYPTFR